VLCCLIGGALVAWVARSARRSGGRPVNPLLTLLFGFGAGWLVVALIVSVLVPLGVVDVTGPLAARIALLAIPAVAAGVATRAGAAGALLNRSGTTLVMVATVAGALTAEELDLHGLTLHSAPGVVAGVAVHLPGFLFLVGGLAWRARLPEDGLPDEGAEHACGPARGAEHHVRGVRQPPH
jgi:hypothetical protein